MHDDFNFKLPLTHMGWSMKSDINRQNDCGYWGPRPVLLVGKISSEPRLGGAVPEGNATGATAHFGDLLLLLEPSGPLGSIGPVGSTVPAVPCGFYGNFYAWH